MPVHESIASYSDLAFQSAFAVYLLAAVLLIAQYATARTSRVEERELVGAGAPMQPGRIAEEPRKPLAERLGNMGAAVIVVGIALQVTAIVLRGFATERFPLGNMYEFVTMATTAAMLAASVFLRGQKYRSMWVFVLVPVLILMFLAGTVLYADAAPVVPALRSYWLPIHVTVVSVGSGIFLVAGVASLLFLIRMHQPEGAEHGILGAIARRLPDARALDRLAYRTTIIGFPIFGCGVILGAIWAEAAWGRFWGWDPKETVSFIAWIIYAAYLHARATSGWRETKAAWINLAGFVAMLFNLFVINIVVSGLHSYAGLN
ncbi:c-type cytochrome biogenesis protein CcsB [Skermania sp. ID1734]|uniref:c-type cytochrome biogenesis protein CcsB n=1 Tax=Skermania sp. ID1734 TaxID=2597516 RepID=UPI00117CF248|nr:c-type cytochrome biogenesis protein CcsB [Skermania sp. ID1734]TSD99566.1 c-type cytochrome biogenesis protein CcsB [Skermania sp. ID1734]